VAFAGASAKYFRAAEQRRQRGGRSEKAMHIYLYI
jgi:hypothetical protein